MNNKKITPRQLRDLIKPLPNWKGTPHEFKQLVKSILIPPEKDYEWVLIKKKSRRRPEYYEWERVKL